MKQFTILSVLIISILISANVSGQRLKSKKKNDSEDEIIALKREVFELRKELDTFYSKEIAIKRIEDYLALNTLNDENRKILEEFLHILNHQGDKVIVNSKAITVVMGAYEYTVFLGKENKDFIYREDPRKRIL